MMKNTFPQWLQLLFPSHLSYITLEDYEYNKALTEIEKLLEDIYCKNCNEQGAKQDLEVPEAKKFVLAVLYAIGIDY
jgi:hypothetical protein